MEIRAPRRVGPMIGQPIPDTLIYVGVEVETLDGHRGTVVHYEYFWRGQTDFPVRIGHQTLMLTKRQLKPLTELPAQRHSETPAQHEAAAR